MNLEIIGRKKEKEILQKLLDSSEPTFLAVYGRRRIGKTYLIRNFFKGKGLFFHLTGSAEGSTEIQLKGFAAEFSDVFLKGKKCEQPADWFAAFQLLRKQIEEAGTSRKIILFFDELPWLASPRSGFLQALEHLWNRYLSDNPQIILVVCGSAASWMIDNVINNKGGLHGRVTREIRLLPFTLKETEEFLKKRESRLDRKQILELYMCFGGVAKYLSYVERGKSVAQIVGELCFSYDAPLIAEFHKLFRSLFDHCEEHISIIRELAKTRSGLSYRDLVKNTGLLTGGTFSKRLEELKQSGFIAEIPLFQEGEKSHRYILIDELSIFYLAWQSGVSSLDLQSRGADYWIKQRNTPAWKAWTGFAFECLCLKHIDGIKQALGIAAVQTKTTKWSSRAKTGGAEIDLVIDRADNCINLCEIKFYSEEFAIDKAYAQKLQQKKERFEQLTKTDKATFLTLITTKGAKANEHYHSVIDQQLTMEALFCD